MGALLEDLGVPWPTPGEESIARGAQRQGLGAPHSDARVLQPNGDTPELRDPTRGAARHLAEPAALSRPRGALAEIPGHILAAVLCPALAFLFGEQRPGGPRRTEKS